MQLSVIPFFLLVVIVAGEDNHLGKGPTLRVKQNFQLEKFIGIWYTVKKEQYFWRTREKCTTNLIEFRGKGKAGLMQHYNHGEERSELKMNYFDITTPKKSEPGKLWASFVRGTDEHNFNLWILDTDYDNYAVVWYSGDYWFAIDTEVWILSRKRILDDMNPVEKTMKKMEHYYHLSDIDQSHCG